LVLRARWLFVGIPDPFERQQGFQANRNQEQAAMKIELKEITVRDLTDGYQDNNEAV